MAEFIVKYRAIVYRPFKDEVVDGTVGIVNKAGPDLVFYCNLANIESRWASSRRSVR